MFFITFIFERSDDQVESVGIGAPSVRDVLERDKVGPRVDGADALARMATRQVGLSFPRRAVQQGISNKNIQESDIIAYALCRLYCTGYMHVAAVIVPLHREMYRL